MVARTSLISRRTVQKFRQTAISAAGSLKIKLLLLISFVFMLTLLASCTPSFFGWSQQSVPPVDRNSRKGYTLLINTWKRYDLLKQSISHYTSCPGLDSIHIVWSEPDPPSDPLVKFLNHVVKSNPKDGRHIELTFDINKEDSLNNRFKELKNPITDAVFSIDDDIIFPCSSVEFAFSVWQSAPDTMVGFVPRIHLINQSKENRYPYIYGGWWAVWWTGTYSMILSKASFFHTKYLRMYTNEMPTSLLEYVRRNRNCEDIAMSFLVANATGAPPIWAKGKIYEIGSTGISSLGGHSDKRTECVNRFVSEFGRMTLVPTTVKAVDSRSTWFW
ncbi:putative hexosyltransferase [Helianthus annuus]|uniref:Hexosyltransferase n=1 Tax=Helianthus annuus TaxID=4232 RepID=A0A251UD58_HELAN|nr:glycosyltransferase family 64 protein C4 [Helianthus annuus]KAF5800100.1 putative hexosyltransferase [Helianthus annuus]KAJ0551465.1 putative hexosyltransferase [Helianthus annuus]KAJ0558516.1 putative hexosyltransferase [Helianthus annuus]KAJ0732494.1 putative hexosyltransferase [Helianthus annuus]KAJ0906129.1 putative hexosyltransferase [Helianthus annuus]